MSHDVDDELRTTRRIRKSPTKKAKNKSGTHKNPVTNTDSDQLSEWAKTMMELDKAISGLPDVDSDRINAIRKAIQNGTYQINDAAIAQKIIDFEKLFKDFSDGTG